MVACPTSFGMIAQSVPNCPAVPVYAWYSTSTSDFYVVFDKDLIDCGSSVFNYSVQVSDFVRDVDDSVVFEDYFLQGVAQLGDPSGPENFIKYLAVTPDLIDSNGNVVEAFSIVPSIDVPSPEEAVYDAGSGWVDVVFGEGVTIDAAVASDFTLIAGGRTLVPVSIAMEDASKLRIVVAVGSISDKPSRVTYAGRSDGLYNAGGDDVPAFVWPVTVS